MFVRGETFSYIVLLMWCVSLPTVSFVSTENHVLCVSYLAVRARQGVGAGMEQRWKGASEQMESKFCPHSVARETGVAVAACCAAPSHTLTEGGWGHQQQVRGPPIGTSRWGRGGGRGRAEGGRRRRRREKAKIREKSDKK